MAKRVKVKSEKIEVIERIIEDVPSQPEFILAYIEVKNGQIALSQEQYERIRLEMMKDTAKGVYNEVMLERVNKSFASKEFLTDTGAVQKVLKWLWDKYIGGKVNDQIVANTLFEVLLKGVENGAKAIARWLKSKNNTAVDDMTDVIQTAAEVIQSGKIEDFKNEINDHLADIKKQNEVDKNSGKKVGWFRRALNALKEFLDN